MPMFTPEKAVGNLSKTPVILNAILHGVDQARAQQATDGPDGWSVLEVMCHLNDMEQIYFDRARLAVETDLPKYPDFDQNASVIANHYAEQNFADVWASTLSKRRAFLAFLRGLTPDQWGRRGIHP